MFTNIPKMHIFYYRHKEVKIGFQSQNTWSVFLHTKFNLQNYFSSLRKLLLSLSIWTFTDGRFIDGHVFAGSVTCFGQECYALAFGVPAALMLVAVSKYSEKTI